MQVRESKLKEKILLKQPRCTTLRSGYYPGALDP